MRRSSPGEVRAGLPDVIEVREPHTRLADRERVRGRARLAADHPRLKRIHARLDEEDVVPPPSDNRIALHSDVAVLLEEREEVLAHGAIGQFLFERRVPDEVVLLARGLAARFVVSKRPERRAALRTRLAGEPLLPEQLDFILALRHFGIRTSRGP